MEKANWAIIGLGFISQRHIQAIQDIGDNLVMACDYDESKWQKVGGMNGIRLFNNWIEMLNSTNFKAVDYVTICTPNYLHYEMIEGCLNRGKKVLCEKPLVISGDSLEKLSAKQDLFTVLQLRHNPELQDFKNRVDSNMEFYNGKMNIKVHRGQFYFDGWKANEEQSGGLLYNIGIHYIDLLVWFFGEPTEIKVFDDSTEKTINGLLKFNRAEILWTISVEAPMDNQIRQIQFEGLILDLTRHFEDLHTKVYQDIKNGKGISLTEASRSLLLADKLKNYERTSR